MDSGMAERFRKWYAHEKDCNAKILQMLDSVPPDARTRPEYQRAVDLMMHLVRARTIWLYRMGALEDAPDEWFPANFPSECLPTEVEEVEAAWDRYMAALDELELERHFQFGASDGGRWDSGVECVLTQVNGHHWYHRGQIALLLEMCGAKTVDTDYIFWHHREHGEPKQIP